MTPIILWGLLTPGVLAAANALVLAVALWTATKVWRAAVAGGPGPALIGTAITGFFAYLSYQVIIGAGPISVAPQGWEHQRIETGWGYYYAAAMGALILLWALLLLAFTVEALMAIGAYIAWLDKPSATSSSWGAITNRRRLHRLWRLRVNEQRLARAVTKHLDPTIGAPLRLFATTGVLGTVRTIGETRISTAFELNAYGTGAEVRQAHPGLCDMLDDLIANPRRSGIESMFLDTDNESITRPPRPARLHVDWALDTLDLNTSHGTRPFLGRLRPQRHVEFAGTDPR
ncbi:hypothetical protein EB73_34830 [Mycobacterium sp. SWH-M3]|nr:hypothetical protein EB73_34830 [Mycobacterium sp. SWH-M3]